MFELNLQSIKTLAVSTTHDSKASLALLVARIPFCLALLYFHGLEKITGYNTMVEHFRNPLGLGTHFTLAFALAADAICSVMIVLGFFTRPAAVIIFVNVLVAMIFIHPWEQRILMYIAANALFALAGAGRFSLDYLVFKQTHES